MLAGVNFKHFHGALYESFATNCGRKSANLKIINLVG